MFKFISIFNLYIELITEVAAYVPQFVAFILKSIKVTYCQKYALPFVVVVLFKSKIGFHFLWRRRISATGSRFHS